VAAEAAWAVSAVPVAQGARVVLAAPVASDGPEVQAASAVLAALAAQDVLEVPAELAVLVALAVPVAPDGRASVLAKAAASIIAATG
jgi:hypothetical protein